MLIKRRSLLAASTLAAAAPRNAWGQRRSSGVFTHGVASGDPLPDGVVIWTRFTGETAGWEVAEDEAFSHIVQSGQARSSFVNDYCVKVDVRGLAPGRRYFYRFLSASDASVIGRTRTAPAGAVEQLRIALFSCSNMPFGYFHAYGHAAARDDIDLVLHVGDYIYETPRGAYPSAAEAVPGRVIDPVNETASLSDYYQRYASYHTDANLLELRRTKPISSVWDDHELVNNAWRNGSPNHNARYEGDYQTRIAAAAKAYFDWMPIRRPGALQLYRHLDWGDLARIVLIDARYIGRDEQIDYRTTLAPQLAQGGAEARAAADAFRRTVLGDPARTMLGAAQEQWFARTLAASKQRGQTWQIVAQQIVVGDQFAPAETTRLFSESLSSGSRQWFTSGVEMGALGLAWNTDAWAGYPAARQRFLDACAQHANNAIVLGGDSHNCWVNNLAAPGGGRLAALEFATGSVTSPGFERSLTAAGAGEREALFRAANPHLAWCDLTNRGYTALRFTRGGCETDWIAFDSVRTPQAPAPAVTRISAAASASGGPGAWAL